MFGKLLASDRRRLVAHTALLCVDGSRSGTKRWHQPRLHLQLPLIVHNFHDAQNRTAQHNNHHFSTWYRYRKTVVNSHMLWLRYLQRAAPYAVKIAVVNSLTLRRCLITDGPLTVDLLCRRRSTLTSNVYNGRHDVVIGIRAEQARCGHRDGFSVKTPFHPGSPSFRSYHQTKPVTVPLRSAPRSSY